MEKRMYPALDMETYTEVLPSGLQVLLVRTPGFTKKTAYFVTSYGAMHRDFLCNGEKMTTPAGVAHYLEHKIFDMPQGDITQEFANLGASVNAFTSYDLTAYHFTCTDHFEKNLSLLLQFVTTPYFTEDSVKKEQGIIGQEIDMVLDTPDTRVFENLMEAMYESHPIRVPILGTQESIAQITPEILQLCHRCFYRPENMFLCVLGDVDPETVKECAMQVFTDKQPLQVEKIRCSQEEMVCPRKEISQQMDVSMPMFHLGFKCEPPAQGGAGVHWETVGDLAAEWLFGESSELYLKLYEQGLIDGSFGGGFETVEGMAMLSCSGDSKDAQKVQSAILNQAEKLIKQGLSAEDFQRMKRSALGRRIRDLDSFSSTAFRLCAYHFNGFDYFRFPEIYAAVKAEELIEFLKQSVTPDRAALSIIYPCKEETK